MDLGTTQLELDFDAALTMWDADRKSGRRHVRIRRALFAAWWFIENASPEVPGCTDVFFRVRALVHQATR